MLGLDVERPDDRSRWAIGWRISPKSACFRLFVLDSCEPGLQGAPHCLPSRWSASHYGSLRTLHAHFARSASRELWIGCRSVRAASRPTSSSLSSEDYHADFGLPGRWALSR